ncbi:D-alanyl-D-alanine carboxypeptidase [Sinorhizobium meliloti]|uniref:D-alanyl-D-alanine carboxypeptidase n=1 Tax=Rhizobium meliloti TaxID=382 RepID=UPI000FD75333|nr:D-alanyl-D-alanine carboxypeptidase [Sinorhizobium meliloti]RVM04665.1 peptidase M15 [Sinorhizobium meliloti]RVO22427.1 peptidase M15 [Sinorhizobium meliloti]RVO47880.1 peptidase M15 [Sinorhizobium meliloti]
MGNLSRSLRNNFLTKAILAFAFNIILYATQVHAGYAQLIIDANTGKVLSSENADVLNRPASLTKMMTLYMTFEALHDGRLTWDKRITMTKNGAATIPTKLGVPAGKNFTVREAVLGMIVKSANDAAEAMGDHLAGSEAKFADAMTRKARQLGMSRTTFRNASGLPNSRQVTTARDMATLAVALMRDYPKEYALFSERSFVFRGREIAGHNNLMYRYKGMDGIKTGYTNASGFNLVSAVNDNGRHVVGVVLGGKTARSRDARMAALLDAAMPAASLRGRSAIAQASVLDDLDLSNIPLPISADRTGAIEMASVSADVTGSIQATDAMPVAGNSGGWEIQIAATDSDKAAKILLSKAQSDALAGFSEISSYTQRIKSNVATLYRARFTGFDSRSSAASACKALKSHSYSCLMLPNKG